MRFSIMLAKFGVEIIIQKFRCKKGECRNLFEESFTEVYAQLSHDSLLIKPNYETLSARPHPAPVYQPVLKHPAPALHLIQQWWLVSTPLRR